MILLSQAGTPSAEVPVRLRLGAHPHVFRAGRAHVSVGTVLQLSDQILQVSNSDWSHLVLIQTVARAVQLLPLPALLPQLLLAPVLVDGPGLGQVPLELLREDGGPVGAEAESSYTLTSLDTSNES